jgi:hypothetical protein
MTCMLGQSRVNRPRSVKELQIRFAIFYAPASLLIFRSGTCMPGFSHHLFPEYTMHSVARGLITIALLLPAVFSPSFGFGQNVERMTTNSAKENPVPAHRPVIGIALSGGGALGLAHIGALLPSFPMVRRPRFLPMSRPEPPFTERPGSFRCSRAGLMFRWAGCSRIVWVIQRGARTCAETSRSCSISIPR